jgi:hypothetical protein
MQIKAMKRYYYTLFRKPFKGLVKMWRNWNSRALPVGV